MTRRFTHPTFIGSSTNMETNGACGVNMNLLIGFVENFLKKKVFGDKRGYDNTQQRAVFTKTVTVNKFKCPPPYFLCHDGVSELK